jgi:hypothetical protein
MKKLGTIRTLIHAGLAAVAFVVLTGRVGSEQGRA